MRVLFVTPECAPLTKTGGLGDVSQALPAALRRLGIEVRTLLPGYREVMAGLDLRLLASINVLDVEARLLEGDHYLVIDCPQLYGREGGPYQNATGEGWPDNGLRFGLLSKVAALLGSAASPIAWTAQVVHCNDWPCGLAPVYLNEATPRAKTLMTIHNLAFQGNFGAPLVERLGLPGRVFSMAGLEFYGRMSFLKGGLVFADAITTVSPAYAREIQTAAFGFGLDGVLRERRDALFGILNGIDTEAWNPATDARIAERYDASRLHGKAVNKRALQQRIGLAIDPGVPLLASISRFAHQKGIDLIIDAADELAAAPAQLAVLGTGERQIEDALRAAQARHPGKIAVSLGFDEDLAHLIEAGADMFLMPSRYEPCGLNQMYSQRYGTPPVARRTGGLADTIADGETGFLFYEEKLITAVQRALSAWREAPRWREIQRVAMARDFSWAAPARQYADLYSRLATRPAA
jgi:starch synthase